MQVISWSLLEFEMIPVFLFVSVIFSYLPPLHSVTNNSMPTCPASFSCPALTPFSYPFYDVGLIKVSYTLEGAEIQIGGNSYRILSKFDFHRNSSRLFLWNQKFGKLVKDSACEALMNNFTSPSPSPILYSVSVVNFINLFKCTNNLTNFEQHNYNSYNGCKDHNFYYNYFNTTVPSDLPKTCKVVQLPVNTPSTPGFDETNIFSLLYPGTSIFFNLSHSCSECWRKDQTCDTENGLVLCFRVKWENSRIKQTGDRTTKILVIAGSTLIFMFMTFVIFIICRRRKNNPFSYVSSKNKSLNLEDINLSNGVSVFSYKELEDATQNFEPSHELGDGGFGAVHYGKLKDGREVAVKKLHEHNYNRARHFRSEVEILTKLRHPNLVVLYGYTSRQSRELLLVYEYVPNGTVADHLHGEQTNSSIITWPIRMNIAIDTASALSYLHASEVVHRDVKTSNILLDQNFCVKVADFDLSRLISNSVTHVSTAPQGTPGYLDPQYHQRYQLTDKSDVYSFGVVLIELISSMVAVDLDRSQDEISLANLAISKIKRCAIDELIDPVFGSDTNPEIMSMITLVAELAFRCLQYDSDMRPTMNEVLDVLMDIQAVGRTDVYDSIRDLQTVSVQPLSETNDEIILLKDFVCSRVSVASERKSNNSASTTLSSNGDRSVVKNDIDT
ncbi:LEAF RUST 10 DISEASE-RESISTANCE LOCUS RECEPTOR-LIKE PROTEIN KINASE-like 1.1 [Bidens hawaiensis]|uniref:LEAF RUST 10 DISEASE-RESISTANCE LOCUS RECEPTOR-LIKE PROTEIN KINASE-like 1.1 n=1 Tax=Bidens hawaiensis TaxID=980011 RepID=UPI00404A70F7